MADDVKVSSFDESDYFRGPSKILFSHNLEREADEVDKWLESIHNGSEISVSRILLIVLQEAMLAKASFIHIHPRQAEFLIRYRIGKRLWEANAFPKHVYAPFCARIKIISNVNIAERRVPQFGRFFYEQSGFLNELRMCSIPTQEGEAFVMTLLQQTGNSDYTVDRHQWLDPLTLAEILDQINALQQRKSE